MRLLVVEDNQSLVANLFDYFEARGHLLDAARGCWRAWMAVRSARAVAGRQWAFPK